MTDKEDSRDRLSSLWASQRDQQLNVSWADMTSDDSRSMDDSRSCGEMPNAWGQPRTTALQLQQAQAQAQQAQEQQSPHILVTDDAGDGFLMPSGPARRAWGGQTSAAPADTASQAELFEMLGDNSQAGLNAAFKVGISMGDNSTDSIASDEGSNSGLKRKDGPALPGLTAESQRPSKMPRVDKSATDVVHQSKIRPDAAVVPVSEAAAGEPETSTPAHGTRRVRAKRGVLSAASWEKSIAEHDEQQQQSPSERISGSPINVSAWSKPAPTTPSSWAAVVDPEPRVASVATDAQLEEASGDLADGDAPVGTPARASDATGGEEQRGRTKDRETDEHRLAQRQRQIDIGKNSDEYKLYNETFPSGGRRKRRAKTPDKYQVCSKRSFDGQISKWRRQLHAEVGTSQPKAKGESQQPRAARPRRAKAKPRVDPFFA